MAHTDPPSPELPVPPIPVVDGSLAAPRPELDIRLRAPLPVHRIRVFVILGSLAAFGPASIDMYQPALPTISADLGVSTSAAQLTLAAFLVGLAGGQLLAGSLSDVLGRRRPLFVGIAVYIVASAVCAASASILVLTSARFVQGAASAAGVVISRAIVRDLYSGVEAARYFSRLLLITGLAPVLAPLVGGQMLHFTSWRGVFVTLVVFGSVLLVASATSLPETLPRELRRSGGLRATGRTFHGLLRHRRFIGHAIALGLVAGSFIGYVSASAFVFQDGYGVSPQVSSALFAASGLMIVLSSQLNARIVRSVALRPLLVAGLAAIVVSGAGILVVSAGDLDLVFLVPFLCLLTFAAGFIQPNGMALAVADHPNAAGSAFALIGLLQYGCGALVAPLVGLGDRGSAAPMGVAVIAFGVLALVALATLAPRRLEPGFASVSPVPTAPGDR